MQEGTEKWILGTPRSPSQEGHWRAKRALAFLPGWAKCNLPIGPTEPFHRMWEDAGPE